MRPHAGAPLSPRRFLALFAGGATVVPHHRQHPGARQRAVLALKFLTTVEAEAVAAS